MANDKKFVVKNGLLTQKSVIIGPDDGQAVNITNTADILQVTGNTNIDGTMSFEGASYSLDIKHDGSDTFSILNTEQNNGIVWNGGTAGIEIKYNDIVDLDFTSTGIDFKREPTYLGQVFWNAGNDGSGSGLDADLLDGLDSLQFLRSDEDDTFDGNLIITGDLTVSGNTTYVNTEQVLIADNIITLNSNFTTGAPTENAGWEVLRGDLANSSLQWDETSDYFKLISGGTDLGRIITTADEGSGNGFDADTVDGLEAEQFLRADADDTATGNITIERDLTIGDNTTPARIFFDGVNANRILYSNNGQIGFLNAGFNYAAWSSSSGDWIAERNLEAGNDVKADENVYGKKFYDVDNNNYYLDPNANSVLGEIGIDTRIFHNGDTGTDINFGSGTFSVNIAGNTKVSVTAAEIESLVPIVAPKLIDRDDPTYFVDPSLTSEMSQIDIDSYLRHRGDLDTYIGFSGADTFKIFTGGTERVNIDNDSADFAQNIYAPAFYDSANNTYYGDFGNSVISLNLAGDIITDGSVTANNIIASGDGTFTGDVSGVNAYFSKFYDADNNNYYLDPEGNSVLQGIGIDDILFHNGDIDTQIQFTADNISIQTGGTERLGINNTRVEVSNELRSPIYYDTLNQTDFLDLGASGANDALSIRARINVGGGTDVIRSDDTTGTGGITLAPYAGLAATSNPTIDISGGAGGKSLASFNRLGVGANPFAASGLNSMFLDFRVDGAKVFDVRTDSAKNTYFIGDYDWQFWNATNFTGLFAILPDGSVTVNNVSTTYSDGGDNTALTATPSNPKLHVDGSIYLNGANDGIIFGRGTASFLKDEELAFGWGSGWYMSDATYLRVRNNVDVYSTGAAVFDIFKDSTDSQYYMDFTAGGKLKGNFEVAATSTGTSYTTAAIELRESNYTATAAATPPHLAFHWGGVVASQISIESSGRIAVKNNPGTAYEDLVADEIYGNKFYDTANNAFFWNPNINNAHRLATPTGYLDIGSMNTSYVHFQTDRDTFYFQKPVAFDGNIYGYTGNETATFDQFIDSANNSFYGDFSGTSVMARVTMPQNPVSQGYSTTALQPTYYIGQTTGTDGGWKLYSESPSGASTGAVIIQSEDDFDGDESIRMRFKKTASPYNTRDNLIAYFDHVYTPTQFRAPRFVDSDNVNFYGDFASTSLTNTMRAQKFEVDSATYTIDGVTGDYGSIKVAGATGGWAGYAINDDWVFMSNGTTNAGIYNDTRNEWALYAEDNNFTRLYANGVHQIGAENGYGYAINQMRAPVYYPPSTTSWYLDLDNGNTNTTLRSQGIIDRANFATSGDGSNNIFLRAQDYSHWIWQTATNWGIFWAGNDNPAYSHFSTSNPNEIVFVGSGNLRASIDLDNGNAYFQGTLSAGSFAINGGNEDLGLLKHYGTGLADDTLFDGSEYWDRRVVNVLQGSETNNIQTADYAKSGDSPTASSYVVRTSGYRVFYSDYIAVEPGEEIYGEMAVKTISGSGGRFYYGVERFDKDKNPIAGNTGTTYFVAGGSIPTSTSWEVFSGYTTIPTTHTVYNGSDGSGCRFVRIRILMNYSTGGALREYGAPILKRSNTQGRIRSKGIWSEADVNASGNVYGKIFYDTDDNNYYLDPASTSTLNQVDVERLRSRGSTGNFWDGEDQYAMQVYGEISNSNYAGGNLQPGALNIGRTDTNYRWDGTTWSSDVRVGILANASEYWEFAIHDSGDEVNSMLYYDGTNDLFLGRDIGWGTMAINMPGSAYAPTYFDSDDANYRGNFAGTSIMNYIDTANYVTVGGGTAASTNNPYNSVSSTRLLFGSRDSNAVGNYFIGTNMENYGGNYTKLDLRWHTGIRMGAQPSYGGTRIFNNEDLTTLLFSVGRGDGNTRVESGNFYVTAGNAYARIFIDQNDPNYYVDPNSLSKIWATNVQEYITIGGNNTTYAYDPTNRPSLYMNGSYPHLTLFDTTNTNTTHGAVLSFGSTKASGGYRKWNIGTAARDAESIQIGYFDNQNNPHYGVGVNGWTYDSYSRLVVRTGYTEARGSMRSPIFYDLDNPSYYGNFATTSNMNTVQINGTVRFMNYGLGMTGTYASTRLQTIFNMDDQYSINAAGTATQNAYGLYWSHPNAGSLGGANNLNDHGLLIINNGSFRAAISSRAVFSNEVRGTLFRDYNNANYYLDPAGASNLNTSVRANEFYARNWFRNDNSGEGLYNQATTQHWYSDSDDGWNLGGGGGYNWIRFRDEYAGTIRGYVYAVGTGTDVNSFGLLNNGGSWRVKIQNGDYVQFDGSSARAAIFYDRNNPSFYGDFGSTSRMNYVSVNNVYDAQTRRFAMPDGATYTTSASTVNGVLTIYLPTSRYNGNTMLHFDVNVYEYNFGRMSTFRVGGYAYSSGRWTNVSVTQLTDSDYGRVNFRFGTDGSRHIVCIGEYKGWQYPQVSVTNVHTGYSSFTSDWGSGWTIGFRSNGNYGTVRQTRTASMALTTNNASNYNTTMYATRYYDYDNVSYYGDFASTSRMNVINANTYSMNDGWAIYDDDADTMSIRSNNSDHGEIIFRDSNSTNCGRIYFDDDSHWGFKSPDNEWQIYLERNARTILYYNGVQQARTQNGYFEANNAMHSPYFADTDDTAKRFNGATIHGTSFEGANARTMAFLGKPGHTRDSGEYYRARPRITGDTNYWTGIYGWGRQDMTNTVADWGSGFIDTWSNPANQPSGTSHWVGVQAYHYSNGSARYGWQMVGGPIGNLRFRNSWASFTGWKTIPVLDVNSSNGGVLYAGQFTDADTTDRYVNPGSTSYINELLIGGPIKLLGPSMGVYRGIEFDTSYHGIFGMDGSGNASNTTMRINVYDSLLINLDSDNNLDTQDAHFRIGQHGLASGSIAQAGYSGGMFSVFATATPYVVSDYDMKAPRFVDNDDSNYYINPASNSNINTMDFDRLDGPSTSSFDKIRVYDSSSYAIGMVSGRNFGALGDWAMTFRFNNDTNRGFWWGHTDHDANQGAMSLTTNGRLVVADSFKVGGGSGDTGAPSYDLHVVGTGYADSSFRSPIFYDHDDDSYFGHFGNISRMNVIEANVYDSPYNGSNSGSSYDRSDWPYGWGFQENGAWSSPYPDLVLQYHTGITMAAYGGYGGIRFERDYNNNTLNWSMNYNTSGYSYKAAWQLTNTSGYYSSTNGWHIYPNSSTSYGSMNLLGNRNNYYGFAMSQASNDIHWMFRNTGGGYGGLYYQGLGRWAWFYHPDNNCLGIASSTTSSTYELYVSGDIYATGDIVAFSDERHKENIVTIDNALDKVLNLRGVYYDWKWRPKDKDHRRHMGVIAQETAEVIPEVITYDEENDRYGVAYDKLVGVLIEATKDQQDLINKQDERLESQQKEIDNLKEMVYKLINGENK